MRWLWIAVALVVVALIGWLALREPAPAPPTADAATAVETAQGRVVGYMSEDAYAWRGIPFAKPPVDELRWRAPQPPAPTDEPLMATETGSACLQLENMLADFEDADGDGVIGGEDCLYLNVYAPAGAPGDGKRHPVMFWIHGGGNSIGHAGPYDGSRLAAHHDVVLVAVNYRLGPFGWFTHAALRDAAATPEDASGNFGTLDLVRGLEWVRDNIAAFGGDPANVTIFGESAGGTNVLSLLSSPRAAGLFHRAIAQSGGHRVTPPAEGEAFAEGETPGHRHSSSEVLAQLLAQDGTGLPAAREQLRGMSHAEIRSLLREADGAEFLTLYRGDGGSGFAMIDFPALFGDGAVLPNATTEATFADTAHYNAVPTIFGTNRDEVKLFMALDPRWVERRFWLFPRLKDAAAYERAARYGSDSWKERGVDRLARLLSTAQGDTVYAYRFDWDELGSVFGYDLALAMGAAHGLEIAFVFGDFEGSALAFGDIYDDTRLAERDALSSSMMSYWAEFAHRGDPGRGRDGTGLEWQPWRSDPDVDRMIVFDTPADGGIRMSAETVTLDGLKARLAADTSFADQCERCFTYASLFLRDPNWDHAEYASFGGGEGCSAFPPNEFRFF